jgi:ubiquinone/menaquinone biosynthesis C-methylase UbiE
MKCLCLGARTGQEVVALQQLKMDPIGIDIVPNEPYVIYGDIHDLKYENETFDFSYTNVFDHSIYPSKFISEIERVLKISGHVLIQLQINKRIDKYSENEIYNARNVIDLFKNSICIKQKKIGNTLGMNYEILIKKTIN